MPCEHIPNLGCKGASRLASELVLGSAPKPHGCGDRRRKLADVALGQNRTRPPPLLTLKHLEEAAWPSGIDGPATVQRLKAFCAKHGFAGPWTKGSWEG